MPAGAAELGDQLQTAVAEMATWMREYGDAATHPAQEIPLAELETATAELRQRLRDNYPFFHPRYAGQMLKPPHPAAVIGYVTAMLVNPNNHALDGGPATAAMEKEVVAQLAAMFGFAGSTGAPGTSATSPAAGRSPTSRHCSSRGRSTPARRSRTAPTRTTPTPGCAHLLGVEGDRGRRRPPSARWTSTRWSGCCASGRVGTVVATTGTTGLGAVDPVHEIVALSRAGTASGCTSTPRTAGSSG